MAQENPTFLTTNKNEDTGPPKQAARLRAARTHVAETIRHLPRNHTSHGETVCPGCTPYGWWFSLGLPPAATMSNGLHGQGLRGGNPKLPTRTRALWRGNAFREKSLPIQRLLMIPRAAAPAPAHAVGQRRHPSVLLHARRLRGVHGHRQSNEEHASASKSSPMKPNAPQAVRLEGLVELVADVHAQLGAHPDGEGGVLEAHEDEDRVRGASARLLRGLRHSPRSSRARQPSRRAYICTNSCQKHMNVHTNTLRGARAKT